MTARRRFPLVPVDDTSRCRHAGCSRPALRGWKVCLEHATAVIGRHVEHIAPPEPVELASKGELRDHATTRDHATSGVPR